MRERARRGVRITWIGLWVNLVLSFAKAAGGVLGGSQALLADALHSVSDMCSDVIVLFAVHYSSEPADRTHPYGHGRIETAAAFSVGILLLLAGLYMFAQSVMNIWIPRPYRLNFLALPFIVIAIALKEGLYRYTLGVGKSTLNQALIANAWHHRSDAISSFATLGGVGLAVMGYWMADAFAAAGVAVLVIWAGFRITRDSLDVLVDAAPPDEVLSRIRVVIGEVDGVRDVHALRTRQVGPDLFVDVHIKVDGDLSVSEGHVIAHKCQDSVIQRVEEVSEVNVHVEPDAPVSLS